eukprot:TRINITY_DN57769_c0_g1_i1.p1 TRINITY_DN57769_c0_g1~~TRINITY_DN57769_c0_g1_i1.p1  ORF type:complete len:491 (-),score=63.64 TRINITY_DN57769_c0_g1_i1:200-1549(-)
MLVQGSASDTSSTSAEGNEATNAGSTEHAVKTIKGLAALVENMTTNPLVTEQAEQMKAFAEQGSLLSHKQDALGFLDAAEVLITPEVAAQHGLLVNRNDLDEMSGVQYSEGISFNPEAVAPRTYEGDIMPARASDQDSGKRFGAGKAWPDAIVKYCVDPKINPFSEKAFKESVFSIRSAAPGIQFKDIGIGSEDSCTEVPSIFVTSAEAGCWSELGMIWMGFPGEKSQRLNLKSPGCDNMPTALHELLHGMGMAHEHVRSDRDDYISVHKENIKDGKAEQFSKTDAADTNRPYDILSIMHYVDDEFSKEKGRLPTITVKDKGYQVYTNDPNQHYKYKLGQRMGMSAYDIAQLADLYGCNDERTVCQPPDPGMKMFHIILIAAGSVLCCAFISMCAFCACQRMSGKMSRQETSRLLEEGRRSGLPAAGGRMPAGWQGQQQAFRGHAQYLR